MSIEFTPITRNNWRKTLEIRVAPGQLSFVADYEPVSLVILAKSYVGAGGADWYPIAIEYQSEIVGILALAVEDIQCWMFHLLIDKRHQGKGIGTMTVELLKTVVRDNWPQCNSIKITVHPDNLAAKKLYTLSGFVESGEIENSEVVMEYKFTTE